MYSLFKIPIVATAAPRFILKVWILVLGRKRVFSVQHVTADRPFVLFAGQHAVGRKPLRSLRERTRVFLVLNKNGRINAKPSTEHARYFRIFQSEKKNGFTT